ncbi:helix-turn-helix domain-containing protein [Treponema sp. R6D11]
MDRLQTMRVFQTVADEAGFSAAARRLDMSVPTVTRLVADLEQHLGTRLLQRTTRSVSLTEAGGVSGVSEGMALIVQSGSPPPCQPVPTGWEEPPGSTQAAPRASTYSA